MKAKRNPVSRISARLSKLKQTEIVTKSALVHAKSEASYIMFADQTFLREEIQAVARAARELGALAPEIHGDVLL